MKLELDPATTCILECKGTRVEIASDEIGALQPFLPENGEPDQGPLPGMVRKLFESGLLVPSDARRVAAADHWHAVLPGVATSPFLTLLPRFVSAGSDGPDSIEPGVYLYLDPELVDLVSGLAEELGSILNTALSACVVRGRPFDRRAGLQLLYKTARTWLDSRPHARRWLRWTSGPDDAFDLRVREEAPVTRSEPSCDGVNLLVSVARPDGASRSTRVRIALADLPGLAQVMDFLRQPESISAWREAVAEPAVRRVLSAIHDAGGFVPREEAPPVYRRATFDQAVLTATHMGHASVIVDAGRRRILVDPWLFAWKPGFEKQPATSAELGEIAAILFTHHHEDHMESAALMTLPHGVPVYVPHDGAGRFAPRMTGYLRALGFRDVRSIGHGESVELDDGVTIEAVPFFGEGRNRLGFGGNCYLISRRGRSMLFHADASPDSHGDSLVSSGHLRDLVARRGRVDIIFGTWWQERKFLCELSPMALIAPAERPSQWLDDTESCDCPQEFLRALVEESGARLFVFYAEGGAGGFAPSQAMSSRVPALSFGWRSREDVGSALEAQTGVAVVQAQPFLRVVLEGGGAPRVDRTDVAPSRVHLVIG
jgi:hypothetical protein